MKLLYITQTDMRRCSWIIISAREVMWLCYRSGGLPWGHRSVLQQQTVWTYSNNQSLISNPTLVTTSSWFFEINTRCCEILSLISFLNKCSLADGNILYYGIERFYSTKLSLISCVSQKISSWSINKFVVLYCEILDFVVSSNSCTLISRNSLQFRTWPQRLEKIPYHSSGYE